MRATAAALGFAAQKPDGSLVGMGAPGRSDCDSAKQGMQRTTNSRIRRGTQRIMEEAS